MNEKELMEMFNFKKDENTEQMISKINKAIDKVLDHIAGADNPIYILPSTESIKNLIIARKILMHEKQSYDVLDKVKGILGEEVI